MAKFRKLVNIFINNAVPYLGTAVHYYNQRRIWWYFRRYGDLRAGRAACGPFAAAIAISTLLQRRVDPSITMKFAVERGHCAGGTYESFVSAVMMEYGVACRELLPPETISAMTESSSGIFAIALVKAGTFSAARHYVCLRLLANGRCRVYDSSDVRNCYRSFNRAWLANRTDRLWILAPSAKNDN